MERDFPFSQPDLVLAANPAPEDAATPAPPAEAAEGAGGGCATAAKPAAHPDPTRYGDWEMHGKCVDF
jgi:hypothetical protein